MYDYLFISAILDYANYFRVGLSIFKFCGRSKVCRTRGRRKRSEQSRMEALKQMNKVMKTEVRGGKGWTNVSEGRLLGGRALI